MNRKKLLLAGACLLLALVLAAGHTFAWLNKEQGTSDAYTALSDFEVEGTLSFGGTVYEGDSILVPVSFDPQSPTYIGQMKYVVRYTGVSPALLRVRVLEQWVDVSANEIMPVNFLPYSLSTEVRRLAPDPDRSGIIPAAGLGDGDDALAQTGAWLDHREADYCYYYSVPVQPKALTTPKDSPVVAVTDGQVELTLFAQTPDNTAPMIEGIDPDNTQLMLLIEVEAVQPNRFREFWGIDALPTA